MEVFLIRALQLILCFSLLVLLHEAGHFLFAKLFKVRVEKFSLFFDPWFHLAKYKPKKSDTTYVLGWLPLGGYVKISGMVDESMDKEQLQQPVKPWEFRAKPAWQRLLIMVGGVLVNFVLAFVIYAGVLYTWGDTYVPMRNMTHGFMYNEQAQQLGFHNGDIPLAADAKPFDRFDGNIFRELSEARQVTVVRDGREVNIALPGNLNMLEMLKQQPRFLEPTMPSVIDSVAPNTPAAKVGIQAGDQILGYDGHTFTTVNEYNLLRGTMTDVLAQGQRADSLRLSKPMVIVKRATTDCIDTLQLSLGTDYTMGIIWHSPLADYKTETKTFTLLSCIPAGIKHGWEVLVGYVDDLKYLFTKDGAASVGSFGAIGSLFPTTWDWGRFWELTAFISLMLAFMNILPIPALDGGHVFFLLVEVVTRRKPSDAFMERAQMVGMALLLALMAFAVFNDLRNFVF